VASDKDFTGFAPGKVRFTRIPAPFFNELLPLIDDLNELKLTLYVFWQLEQMEGEFRYLQLSDFDEDETFMASLSDSPDKAVDLLDSALSSAVSRGTLLTIAIELEGKMQSFYLLNSARGREAMTQIEGGLWRPSGENRFPIELIQSSENIFGLYESNIGPLTPIIADALKQAEDEFSPLWIEEAFRVAVENNVRKWSYVQAILVRWQEEGRDERSNQRDSEKDRRKYIEGRFSDFIQH
jgi:DnaD/phage-associated family protein